MSKLPSKTQPSAAASRTSVPESGISLDMLSSWHELESVQPEPRPQPRRNPPHVVPAPTAATRTAATAAAQPEDRTAAPARPVQAAPRTEPQSVRPSIVPATPATAVRQAPPVYQTVTPPVYQPVTPPQYSSPARPAYSTFPTKPRRDSSEWLTELLPYVKWGVVALLFVAVSFGVSKLIAGSSSRAQVQTHAIQVKALLSGKPMPGASMTLTPILSPEQTAALDGDLSAGLQLVGRAVLGPDGVGTPGLSPDQPGLPAGEYIAALNWCKVEFKDGETVAGPDLVPQIFRSPSTSTLRVKVAEGTNPLVTLQIVDPKVRARQMSYDHE